ncbi:uncharacterized protein K452DRAFT_59834 [Aplosporella prunicola CBS 121167]|uniref:Uncharacterized protein n=1 Tax=Aplosporella prunicola CBS 121167 TaxID=1176127 RepID=A0A6A6B7A6_9PEZI|nr:uncharacterized protein K452DRAFT_59834 [Aplosporella prunicola CBS 121167]KAF2140042.1 hypothetical protein K452DRAFT_59834 [Aplosporella prunicola CBS 121167]
MELQVADSGGSDSSQCLKWKYLSQLQVEHPYNKYPDTANSNTAHTAIMRICSYKRNKTYSIDHFVDGYRAYTHNKTSSSQKHTKQQYLLHTTAAHPSNRA